MGRPPSLPELTSSSSVTSFCTSEKDRPSTGRKHTEPEPVGLNPAPASSVMAAEGSANRSSSLGWTGLVRPSSVSRKPTRALSGVPAELLLHLVELGQPALQARVRGEDRRQALPGGGVQAHSGREVERVQRLGFAQVLGRDPGHVSRDLDQCALQRARLAGEQRAAAVRGQLTVPGQHADEQEADRVDDDADRPQDEEDRQGAAVVVAAAAAAAATEKLALTGG